MANITRNRISYVDMVSVPLPMQTATYKPVAHETLDSLTMIAASNNGFKLRDSQYLGAAAGKIVTAYHDFDYGDNPEVGLRVAWQNSYNKQVSLKFAIGQTVFLCTNGSFMGSMGAFRKKHVGKVQEFTPEKITEYFAGAKQVHGEMTWQMLEMQARKISKEETASVVGDLYLNTEVLKETQIAIVKKELANPSFNYGHPGTIWELYNYLTYSLKTTHPAKYIDAHTDLNDYFVEKFDLIQATPNAVITLEAE